MSQTDWWPHIRGMAETCVFFFKNPFVQLACDCVRLVVLHTARWTFDMDILYWFVRFHWPIGVPSLSQSIARTSTVRLSYKFVHFHASWMLWHGHRWNRRPCLFSPIKKQHLVFCIRRKWSEPVFSSSSEWIYRFYTLQYWCGAHIPPHTIICRKRVEANVRAVQFVQASLRKVDFQYILRPYTSSGGYALFHAHMYCCRWESHHASLQKAAYVSMCARTHPSCGMANYTGPVAHTGTPHIVKRTHTSTFALIYTHPALLPIQKFKWTHETNTYNC